jgi:flagellar motility protein MotE (MotC chaperone)
MSDTERYYKSNTLGKWFAISSIVFLITLVWTFADDYFREWKSYQRQFRKLEIEKTRAAVSDEQAKLENDAQYQAIIEQLAVAENAIREKQESLSEYEEKLARLKAEHYRDIQNYQFTKADYDAVKYAYEDAVGRGERDVTSKKEELETPSCVIRKLKLRILTKISKSCRIR